MMNRKTISLVITLAFLIFALYVSISTTFIVGLLGLLLIPPVFAVATALIEGLRILLERSNEPADIRKESRVISLSNG